MVSPDPNAPASGRRVVAVGQITQTWHVGAWAPASITLAEVAPGDAIVVLGAYWGDLVAAQAAQARRERRFGEALRGAAKLARHRPRALPRVFGSGDTAAV